MGEEKTRHIKPGELQNVKAVEDVTLRNVKSNMLFSNDTRKMVLELRVMFDALQNGVLNMKSDLDELRRQLALLQQHQCSKGTVKYDLG